MFSRILFCLFAFIGSVYAHIEYDMVDLGLFHTDESNALLINENGAIVGEFREGVDKYVFIWEKDKSIKILDGTISPLKFNNNGQILGWGKNGPLLWDAKLGYISVDLDQVEELNDIGQVLGKKNIDGKYVYCLWENGKVINLDKFLKINVLGDWNLGFKVCINNKGDLAFNVYKQIDTENGQNTLHKTILYRNNVFSMILPDASYTYMFEFDDTGSMLLSLSYGNLSYTAWYNQEKLFRLNSGDYKLYGNYPVERGCLPGTIKINSKGEYYLTPGLRVQKLFKEESPYYNVRSRSTRVNDQNYKGYFVGQIDTIYPAHHAFLAVPKKGENDLHH